MLISAKNTTKQTIVNFKTNTNLRLKMKSTVRPHLTNYNLKVYIGKLEKNKTTPLPPSPKKKTKHTHTHKFQEEQMLKLSIFAILTGLL